MRHLLVTNDFPPKVGGIQSYLWELWRRLDPEEVCVLTTPYAGASEWDATQAYRVERTRDPVLLPHPWLARRIARLATDHRAEAVLLDPALPLGALVGAVQRGTGVPVGIVLHGAEITVPGRLPVSSQVLRNVLRRADFVVAAGGYPLAEAERVAGRALVSLQIPPGVDTDRFVVLDDPARRRARSDFGVDSDALLIVSVSRLVPRKGMDVLISAVARLRARHPNLVLAIAGTGRDEARLRRLAERRLGPGNLGPNNIGAGNLGPNNLGAVRFLGRVSDDDLPRLNACADVWAMLCRDRWGGLEQEGFGIVFLEAAATGVAQVAGRSGGSHEAVVDGATGVIVDDPTSVDDVVEALDGLLSSADHRRRLGAAARQRAVREFSYDLLAQRLDAGLASLIGTAS